MLTYTDILVNTDLSMYIEHLSAHVPITLVNLH